MVGILNSVVGSFYFRGSVKSKDDLPLDASMGDIYISNNDDTTWVCTTTTGKWDAIIDSPSDYYSLINKPVEEKRITYPTNCKNCGAVLHNHICEYCGSNNSI